MPPTTHHLTPIHPNEPGSDDGPGDTRPYLCVPYWETPRFPGDPVDIGQVRPLPAGVISWECPGIHASPYLPGQELQVTVGVRNSGHGSATVVATVVVYWADPTVGFAKPSFFGATTVAVPTMRDPMAPGFVSATLSGVIPATAPNHICLLAYVTHSLDQAKAAADPVGDRHWAQHNLVAVSTTISPMIVPFVAANPFDTEGLFELRVRALDRRALELFALRMKFEPSEAQPRLQLVDGLGRPVTDRTSEAQTQLALGPHGRRRYSLMLELDQRLAPHQLTAIEVVLYQSKDQQRPVGSLGIVVRGDDSET
jgi:hypothetical protein